MSLSATDMVKASIRPYQLADIPALVGIEERVQFTPWGESLFREPLSIERYAGRVLCKQDSVIGFYLIEQVCDEVTLHNIAISPSEQGLGYGRQLLQDVELLARQQQASVIFLEVRESNTAARSLYEAENFRPVGQRKDYYAAPWGRESAIVMAKELNS